MKAMQISKYGGSEVFEINNEIPKPIAGKGQVLVEIYAVGLNPVDWKMREGYLQQMAPLKFPATLGGDFAGTVQEIGEGVAVVSIGDEVYGSAMVLSGGSGALAEFATVNTGNIEKKPKNTNFREAAGLPLVGSSAVQALEESIKLQNGQRILIHGGAGGIGSVAIQLAKYLGAYVATTVSTDDKEFVKSLGADDVIDYKQQAFEEKLRDFDAVFDTVGGETTTKSFQVLKKGGVLLSMLGKPDAMLAEKYGVTVIGQGTQTNSAHLKRLAVLVEDGKIKAQTDKVYPLVQVKEAFDYLEKVHPRGKVVLEVIK